jgi:hypothetical protein
MFDTENELAKKRKRAYVVDAEGRWPTFAVDLELALQKGEHNDPLADLHGSTWVENYVENLSMLDWDAYDAGRNSLEKDWLTGFVSTVDPQTDAKIRHRIAELDRLIERIRETTAAAAAAEAEAEARAGGFQRPFFKASIVVNQLF